MRKRAALLLATLILSGCSAEPPRKHAAVTPAKTRSLPVGDLLSDSSKDVQVKQNLETLQHSLDLYGRLHLRAFPESIDSRYLKHLQRTDVNIANSEGLINPYTAKREWPVTGEPVDAAELRMSAPPAVPPGKIIYSPAATGGDFCLIGGGFDGKALRDQFGNTLVLSSIKKDAEP